MNIYLDIDGVLITKDGKPAEYVSEFLDYITNHHNVFWLTTHCRGQENNAKFHLSDKLPERAIATLDKIKVTDWKTLKTEAIDYNQDFRWLDDYTMQAELDILAKHNAKDKIILINLKSEPNILKRLIESGEL
jgi:hypothetical protein